MTSNVAVTAALQQQQQQLQHQMQSMHWGSCMYASQDLGGGVQPWLSITATAHSKSNPYLQPPQYAPYPGQLMQQPMPYLQQQMPTAPQSYPAPGSASYARLKTTASFP